MRKKVILRIKWALGDLCNLLGFKYSSKRYNGEIRTVCFHGVCPTGERFINSRFLTVDHFENLLNAIEEECNIISIDEMLQGRISEKRLNVLLTFDDGYKNFYQYVYPMILFRKIPVTIFCNVQPVLWADLLDIAKNENIELKSVQCAFPEIVNCHWNEIKNWAIQQNSTTLEEFTLELQNALKDTLAKYKSFYQLLSDEELIEMQKSGLISIANHGAAHISYPVMDTEQIIEDYKKGAQRMTRVGSKYSDVFAYPYGHYTDDTFKVLSDIGARVQFIASGDPGHSRNYLDRIVVNPYISIFNQLIALRNGKY